MYAISTTKEQQDIALLFKDSLLISKKIKSDCIRLSAVRMILTRAKHNSPYLAGSFSLSYRVQLKSEDLSHYP